MYDLGEQRVQKRRPRTITSDLVNEVKLIQTT
ncbi:unnamed protein product [Haemonchus placei]|uniref:Uncharacterized protein n=1 Tax=Haemonchus placei TaxID=6290 RepID=A0A3P7TPB6_HAEPC|nr:unnamed protein product [Haemonchus placei]